MKLTAIILLSACMGATAKGYSQKVTLSEKNALLVNVFKEIKKQTGYDFLYNNEMLEKAGPVTIELKGVELQEALEACFNNQPLTYTIVDKTIIVKPKREEQKKITTEFSYSIDVHGRVVNEKGDPVEGVTVTVKGTRNATATNANGEFSLKGVAENATLVFTGTNVESRELSLSNNPGFKLGVGELFAVTLKSKVSPLDEVQVIAYGTTSKRLNTGNVSTIKAEDIEKQPVSNPLAALEGRVPGMFITQTTGVPGGGFKVQIRGQNSIASGTDPFYVIDGVPYTSETLGAINSDLHGGSPLNFINPSDIESIEVLKDADATSIYGSRAANGAVLITTKKGTSGAMKVNFNFYSGFGRVTHMMDELNTTQYLQMRREAFKNDGVTTLPSNGYDLNGTWDTTRYTNWQKTLIGNTSKYSDVQVSITGGNAYTQYLISGGYHRETTVFPSKYPDEKGSAHFNISSMSPNGKFRAAISVSYIADKNSVDINDQTRNALILSPDAPPLYNPDGSLNWAPIKPGQSGTWTNPLNQLAAKYTGLSYNLISNAILNYQIFPGLELKANFGFTNLQTDELSQIPTTYFDPGKLISSGSSQFNNYKIRSWIIEPQANYKLKIGQGLLTVLIGNSFQQRKNDQKSFAATGFSNDALLSDIQAASSISVLSVINSEYKYYAIFGRINYNWKDKYLINLNARRDGSSRFGPSNQFANFGSIGAAWIFSKEKLFHQSIPFISFGKIRGSYGSSGNDQVGDYTFIDQYLVTTYPYQGLQGLYPSNLFNPTLAWEVNKKLEAGIELGFLKDRIIINANFYKNRSANELVITPLSYVTGFSSIPANLPATIENAGVEISIRTINIKAKDFSWLSSFNITMPKNKLIAFPDLANSPYSSSLIIGQPLNVIRAYHSLGVNTTTGTYNFSDINGNPTSNPSFITDRIVNININPKFYGGFQNSFNYKGFSLDIFFQFVSQTGRDIFNTLSSPPGFMSNQPIEALDRWQKPGDVTSFEKFTQRRSTAYTAFSNVRQSDGTYSDASFIRLKNLALSYILPSKWAQKIYMENCRIYLQGQNLTTITHYRGMDPETQGSTLPPLRVLTVGLQITF